MPAQLHSFQSGRGQAQVRGAIYDICGRGGWHSQQRQSADQVEWSPLMGGPRLQKSFARQRYFVLVSLHADRQAAVQPVDDNGWHLLKQITLVAAILICVCNARTVSVRLSSEDFVRFPLHRATQHQHKTHQLIY